MPDNALLEVRGLTVEFPTARGVLKAVNDVDLDVQSAETLAVVGESGCGKTTLARAILGLQEKAAGTVTLHDGLDGAMRAKRIGMVWQDPFASLDPRWTIGKSVSEPWHLAKESGDLGDLLERVGLSAAMGERYPHQLSGGQRQRAAIARALALRPKLVICDEPTAALDLSIQAQILNLLRELQADLGCSFIYISHDLATVRFIADRIKVMYFGEVVESGPVAQVFDDPQHDYTKRLLGSALSLDRLGELPEVASA